VLQSTPLLEIAGYVTRIHTNDVSGEIRVLDLATGILHAAFVPRGVAGAIQVAALGLALVAELELVSGSRRPRAPVSPSRSPVIERRSAALDLGPTRARQGSSPTVRVAPFRAAWNFNLTHLARLAFGRWRPLEFPLPIPVSSGLFWRA